MISNIVCKLRRSSHKLNTCIEIAIGRHDSIDRQDRKCIRCDLNDIQGEFHFVLVCPDYINLRQFKGSYS